jgi:hypothetical protein
VKRVISTSSDRQTLVALVAVLALVLTAFAFLPSGSATALPSGGAHAVPTGTLEPTEPPEDFIPPEISFPMPAGGHQGWFNGTTELNLSATDTGAAATGVVTFTYRLTGAMTATGNLNPAGQKLAITAGGQTTVSLEATDGNGNMATSQRTIGVDRDMPNLNIQTPTHQQTFGLGETVQSAFDCNDQYTGIRTCSSSQPALDTSSLGDKQVTFTATDNVGNTRAQTVTYTVVENEFETTSTPTLTGPAKVGTTLTLTPGVYTPEPTTRTYLWYRDGVVQPAVTGRSYVLTAADLGAEIYAEEVIERETYATWTFGTNMVDPVLAGDFETAIAPTVTGTPKVGQTLTASGATFTPSPSSTTYRWLRDGVAITGATDATYRLVAADAGHRLSVEATGTRVGYAARAVTSTPTDVVVATAGTDGGGTTKPDGTAKATASAVVKVKVLKKRKARVTVRVTADGTPATGGTVTVKKGAKTLASGVKVTGGKAVVTVKKLPKGTKVRLVVRYSGTADVTAAQTKSKRFRVR